MKHLPDKALEILAYVKEANPAAVAAPSMNNAIIGYTYRWDDSGMSVGPVLVYSAGQCITCLINGGCEPDLALEHLEYNYIGDYHGPNSPVFVWDDVVI